MGKTILEILGVIDREDTITNMLQYGINNNPIFANKFISCLAGSNNTGIFEHISAKTRIKVKGGVPDLLVSCIGPDGPVIFVIENKIKAGEGKDQTSRYFKAKEEIKSKISGIRRDIPFTNPQVKFVFLALNPYDTPADNNFIHVDYEKLLDAVKDEALGNKNILNHLWEEFVGAAKEYYKASKISENDLVLEKWIKRDDDPLGKSFLHFATSFREIEEILKQEFIVGPVFKSRAWGTPSYQTTIYKPNWVFQRKKPDKEDLLQELGYHIHFEPTLKETGEKEAELHLYLHYEHGIYRTGKEEKKLAAQHQNLIEEYEKKRDLFKQGMKYIDTQDFRFGGGRNQIGASVLRLNKNMTLGEFKEKFKEMLIPLARKVDSCLNTI